MPADYLLTTKHYPLRLHVSLSLVWQIGYGEGQLVIENICCGTTQLQGKRRDADLTEFGDRIWGDARGYPDTHVSQRRRDMGHPARSSKPGVTPPLSAAVPRSSISRPF